MAGGFITGILANASLHRGFHEDDSRMTARMKNTLSICYQEDTDSKV